MGKKKSLRVVELKKDIQRWRKLPVDVRIAIASSVDRVERIWWEISDSAKVRGLPFVRIHDVGWISKQHGVVFARANIVKVVGYNTFVVELAGSTVYYADDDFIRSILVHEFTHCFYWLKKVVDDLDANKEPCISIIHDPFNQEEDSSLMIDPGEWFGDSDAKRLMHSYDSRMDRVTDTIVEEWYLKDLPVEDPLRIFNVDTVSITDEIRNHIRSLRKKEGG